MPTAVYAGRSARTRREPVIYSCPCGRRFRADAWRALDTHDAQETERLKTGMLNRFDCPGCGATADVQVPVVYHDLASARVVLVLPDAARHRELEERAKYFEELAGDHEPPTDYVLAPEVVFGAAGLRGALGEGVPRVRPSATPTVREVAAVRDAAARETVAREAAARETREAAARDAAAPDPAASDVARTPVVLDDQRPPRGRRFATTIRDIPIVSTREEPVVVMHQPEEHETPVDEPMTGTRRTQPNRPDSDLHTQVRMAVPDPRSAMIERWIAGREGPQALLIDDQVLVCAAMGRAALEGFVAGPVTLRAQLHRLPTYPVLALTFVAGTGRLPDHVLTIPLDIARAAHRVVLEALQRQTRLVLETYDSEYLPTVTHHVEAQLEENIKRLTSEARDALERIVPQNRSFERARQALVQPGYDRLGRTPVDLPDGELESLERPGAVLQALRAVQRWSEPSAEAYLIEIGSVSLTRWRAVRSRAVRRALDLGLVVPRSLADKVTAMGPPLPSWPELLATGLKRFAEVAQRSKPNDLSATEEADNWQHLLRECQKAGVEVDASIQHVAQASLKRARAGQSGGIDLRTLETAELEALLERKELRGEAALVLCERHEPQTLPTLFSAIKRMQRSEASVVLPQVMTFGAAAEKWLIDGLKARRSFVRQGCALALGALKTPGAGAALARALLFEPTEIWSEIARALGDLGAQAVMPLGVLVRQVDPERRERLSRALAEIASRGVTGPVEMLAAGRDREVAEAAERALALVPEVRASGEQMRKGPAGEHTVVRGFSRRFYDALSGGSIELSPDDLEEVDEEEAELILDSDELGLADDSIVADPDDDEPPRSGAGEPGSREATDERSGDAPRGRTGKHRSRQKPERQSAAPERQSAHKDRDETTDRAPRSTLPRTPG